LPIKIADFYRQVNFKKHFQNPLRCKATLKNIFNIFLAKQKKKENEKKKVLVAYLLKNNTAKLFLLRESKILFEENKKRAF